MNGIYKIDKYRGSEESLKAYSVKDIANKPVLFGHNLASSSYLMSFSTLIDLAWILNISALPWKKTKKLLFPTQQQYSVQN